MSELRLYVDEDAGEHAVIHVRLNKGEASIRSIQEISPYSIASVSNKGLTTLASSSCPINAAPSARRSAGWQVSLPELRRRK